MSWENLKKKIFGKSSADDEQGQIQPVQDQGDQEADLTQGPSQEQIKIPDEVLINWIYSLGGKERLLLEALVINDYRMLPIDYSPSHTREIVALDRMLNRVRSVIADDVGKIFYGYKDKEGQHVGGFATKFSRCIGKTTSNGIEITEANWLIYGTRGLWLQTWKEPLQSLCQKIDALKNISKPE